MEYGALLLWGDMLDAIAFLHVYVEMGSGAFSQGGILRAESAIGRIRWCVVLGLDVQRAAGMFVYDGRVQMGSSARTSETD